MFKRTDRRQPVRVVAIVLVVAAACGSDNRASIPALPTSPSPSIPASPMVADIGIYVGTDTGGILSDLSPAPRDAAGAYLLHWESPYTIGLFGISRIPSGRCRTIVVAYSWDATRWVHDCLQRGVEAMSIDFSTPGEDSGSGHRITVGVEERGPDLAQPRMSTVEFEVRLS